MTMKTKKTLAAVAVVLLMFCLVFMAPVSADGNQPDWQGHTGCAEDCEHIAAIGNVHYSSVIAACKAVTDDNPVITIIGNVEDSVVVNNVQTELTDFDLSFLNVSKITFEGKQGHVVKVPASISPHGHGVVHDTEKHVITIDELTFRNLNFVAENGNNVGIGIAQNAPKGGTVTNVELGTLEIIGCTFTNTGSTGENIAIQINSPLNISSVNIEGNTINGYKSGIVLNGDYLGTKNGAVTLKDNVIESIWYNGIQALWNEKITHSIENNTIKCSGKPLNLKASKIATFTKNKVYFSEKYNSDFTPVIYNLLDFVNLDNTNEFYRDNVKLTDYSELMKHLYPVQTGVVIVDGKKDDSNSYYGGFMSAGSTNSFYPPLKDGHAFAQVYSSSDDGDSIGHYIIGAGAISNNDMKLTAGTFAVDPTAFVANGYHVKVDGSNYVVEKDEFGISVENVGFDSVKVGYTQPDAKEVTVKNTGNLPVTLIAPVTSDKYIIGELPTIQPGKSATFTIQPVEGLAVGNYEETITVTTAEGEETTFKVSFLVYQPSSGGSSKPVEEPEEPVEPEVPVEPETPTEEPEAGEATVETEVTDGGEVELETPTAGGSAAADEDEAKITGVVLPTGTDSEVTFVPVSEQAAPAGKETQTKKVFEINVPTYEKGKAAVIKFTMTVAELAADGKEAADVALWHFDEETGEWTKLVTSYTIVDGVVYFEAITEDFSPFAIIYEDEPVDEPQDKPETPESPAPVLGLLAALGAAVVLRRK